MGTPTDREIDDAILDGEERCVHWNDIDGKDQSMAGVIVADDTIGFICVDWGYGVDREYVTSMSKTKECSVCRA